MITMNKTFTGVLIGIAFTSVLILAINENYSAIQIIIGFLLFIFPCIFLSSFKSRTLAMVLTVISMLFAYISYKFNYTDTWAGVLMALIIGIPIYVIKVRKITN